MNDLCPDINLLEFDYHEWKDIAFMIKPCMTDEEFDSDWQEFQAIKRKKKLQ